MWYPTQVECESLIRDFSCENIVLWRGHFNATGQETSVNLSINGGEGISPSLCHFPELT
jgi:hypothetical protein